MKCESKNESFYNVLNMGRGEKDSVLVGVSEDIIQERGGGSVNKEKNYHRKTKGLVLISSGREVKRPQLKGKGRDRRRISTMSLVNRERSENLLLLWERRVRPFVVFCPGGRLARGNYGERRPEKRSRTCEGRDSFFATLGGPQDALKI